MKQVLLLPVKIFWIKPVRLLRFRLVTNYAELLAVALREIKILSRFGKVCMVSAPLFSGGTGDFHRNLSILKKYISMFSRNGVVVWSQVPYLDMHVRKFSHRFTPDTSTKIMEFYVPLLRSHVIGQMICAGETYESYWCNSLGCQTEKEVAIASGISVLAQYCPELHR